MQYGVHCQAVGCSQLSKPKQAKCRTQPTFQLDFCDFTVMPVLPCLSIIVCDVGVVISLSTWEAVAGRVILPNIRRRCTCPPSPCILSRRFVSTFGVACLSSSMHHSRVTSCHSLSFSD